MDIQNSAHLLKKGSIPLYVQLAEILGRQLNENYKEGDQFPTVVQLAEQYEVAPVTVRQALSLLEEDGLISRSRGIGTIVLKKPEMRGRIHLSTGLNDLIESTRGTSSLILRNQVESPPADLVPDFGTLTNCYRNMHRVHAIDNKAYAVLRVYFDEQIYQSFPAGDFEKETIICMIRKIRPQPIANGRQRVTVDTAAADDASWLKIPAGAPVVEIKRYLSDHQGMLIYLARVTYRSDFVSWDMEFAVDADDSSGHEK